MQDTVLVLTNSQDGVHSEVVIQKLEEIGEKVFRFDTDKMSGGELQINFRASERGHYFMARYSGKELISDEVKSVWYRRPNQFNLPVSDPVQRQFAEEELSAFLDGLWMSMRHVFWMNDPHCLERARKKILQLQVAREIGFRIPRTIITNSPDEVRKFLEECGGRIIFKTFKRGFVEWEEKGFNIPTTLISSSHLEKLSLVKKVPALFQECLEKEYELRVTVVGQQLFAVKIDSQAHLLTAIDWRHPELIDKLRYEIYELPKEIGARCLSLTRSFGLEFGALDFVVDKKGHYIFLEINPGGQWYWLEHKLGICVSGAISDKLAAALT